MSAAGEPVRVAFKLYATLTQYLPAGAADHTARLELPSGTTPRAVLDHHGVPPQLAHLVLLNGVYLAPEERDTTTLSDGDTLAVWPPVAGGR